MIEKRRWKHRLTNKDLVRKIADCASCGKNIPIRFSAGIWRCVIGRREQTTGGSTRKKVLKYRGRFLKIRNPSCSQCNFQYSDIRFFDVNHIDGNHNNNQKNNLELLCPNCHRLRTIKLWDNWKK